VPSNECTCGNNLQLFEVENICAHIALLPVITNDESILKVSDDVIRV
jgi:hypothetical protein